MTCPQCSKRVPVRSLWMATNVSGVICPHCSANLCPGPLCTIFLAIIAFGAGEIALLLLRRAAAPLWVAIAGFVVVAAGVYTIIAPRIIRLRAKEKGGRDPRLSGRHA